ncbi:uncharacterized protein LOC114250509 [Bombyx mandarina]|uniref:Uncharacterized protein LOC114250509 n=1 Tax=Bombyx mandarina TaxID=7092 RepID=A0A6J2KF41_BOMMA|nr:uncharacterized protein LOC114250509 [Bombyx mandarina]
MGGQQSVRATHFQRPEKTATDPMLDELPDDHHISISNKMVERLVEDATLASTAAINTGSSKADYKEKMYMEKLRCMDDSHSERCGLTVEDLNALVNRIERLTANIVDSEPICVDCKAKLLQCYNSGNTDTIKCWDAVGDFAKCVHEATAIKLRNRRQKDEKESARKSRHMAHAREHALKDLETHPNLTK